MALPETRTVTRFALLLALVYAAARAAPPLYYAFVEADGASVGGALIAVTWTAAPVYVAAAFVAASPNRAGAWLFLALELALIASFAWQWDAVSHSSTGGLIFVGWPMIQWAAIIIAFVIGWRMRPDFLKD